MKMTIVNIFIIFFFSIKLTSGTVALVKGFLLEEATKNPIATKIFFLDTKGKKTLCNSNSLDGSYQLVLASGERYKVIVENYILTDGENGFFIPDSKEYQEISKNFSGKRLEEGLELLKIKAFEPNENKMIESSLLYFESLKEMMQINPKVHIIVNVSSQDSWFDKKQKKVEIASSKKTKKITYKYVANSTEEQLTELVNNRINSIQSFFNKIDIRDTRVTFKPDVQVKKQVRTKSKKSKTQIDKVENVIVRINKIMNL